MNVWGKWDKCSYQARYGRKGISRAVKGECRRLDALWIADRLLHGVKRDVMGYGRFVPILCISQVQQCEERLSKGSYGKKSKIQHYGLGSIAICSQSSLPSAQEYS